MRLGDSGVWGCGIKVQESAVWVFGLGLCVSESVSLRAAVGIGGLDPYDSPLMSPIVVPKPHSSIPY